MAAGVNQEDRLWSLVLELSAQLATNRHTCDSLRQQLDDLKGQAMHTTTGYALRRFNVDLSQETFNSQLERMNAHLTLENQTLSHECRQLGALLREFEGTLETIMGKFRAFSHAAQQYGLDLTAYYESRIENQSQQMDEMARGDADRIDLVLGRLSDRVRSALRVVQGEDVEDANEEAQADMGARSLEQATEIEQLRAENEMLRHLLGFEQVAKVVPEVEAGHLHSVDPKQAVDSMSIKQDVATPNEATLSSVVASEQKSASEAIAAEAVDEVDAPSRDSSKSASQEKPGAASGSRPAPAKGDGSAAGKGQAEETKDAPVQDAAAKGA